MENLSYELDNLLSDNKIKELKNKLDSIVDKNFDNAKILNLCKNYYEKIGDINSTIKIMNLLIRINSTDTALIKELANYYQLTGNYKMFEKSILKCIRLKPDESDYYLLLEDYYKSLNDDKKLIQLYNEAVKNTHDKIFSLKLKELINETPATTHHETGETLSDIHMIDFINLFEGLENIYARQWVQTNGKAGYLPVREPFTLKVLKRHLSGSITAGIYPIRNGKVKFVAFDLDVKKFAQNLYSNNDEYKNEVLSKMQNTINKILNILKEYNIPAYVEFSGFKGYHIWIFFKDWISAVAAKQFGNKILNLLDIENEPFHIEFFPKQTKATQKNPGNLIKLPLGIHLKTKIRSYFTDKNFNKIDPNLLIAKIKPISAEIFYNSIKDLPYNLTENDIKKVTTDTSKTENQNQITEENPFVPQNDIQFQWIYNKCYVIRSIIDKINDHYELDKNEIVVLKYSLGHLDNGSEIVNHFLKKCINVKPNEFMKSSFSGHPISCPKIRQRLRGTINLAKCNCDFPHLLDFYPNPLAHLDEMSVNNNNSKDKIKIRLMIENYFKMKKELTDLNTRFKQHQKQLFDFLNEVDVDTITTALGNVKIDKKDGKISLYIVV